MMHWYAHLTTHPINAPDLQHPPSIVEGDCFAETQVKVACFLEVHIGVTLVGQVQTGNFNAFSIKTEWVTSHKCEGYLYYQDQRVCLASVVLSEPIGVSIDEFVKPEKQDDKSKLEISDLPTV